MPDLSELLQSLKQIDLNWPLGILGGSLGIWVLTRIWDYRMTRRGEKRQQKLGDLDVVEEWLDAYSKGLTSMRYSVEEFVESQRNLSKGQTNDAVEAASYVDYDDVREHARKLDDLLPKVISIAKRNSGLLEIVKDLAVRMIEIEKTLVDTFERVASGLAELGDPESESVTEQQVEEVASRLRPEITSGLNRGLRMIAEARKEVSSTHEMIRQIAGK